MSQIVWDNILATFYLLLWVVTLVWYQSKSKRLDGGTAIIGSYILYAIFSLLTLNDELFNFLFNPLKLFPYLFLYAMLMIALSPAIYTHFHPSHTIEEPHTRMLNAIAVLIIVCSILLVPYIAENFSSGLVKLFTDADAGKDAYMEQAEGASDSGSGISNIPAILFNAMSDLTVFLCFYFLTLKKKNFWLIFGLFFSIVISVLVPIIQGARGNVVAAMFTVVVGYMMFRQFIEKKLNRLIQVIGLSFMLATALPITAITVSRFGNMSTGIASFLNWYVGQGSLYFNNYAFDTGGTRNGDRILNLAKRAIDSDTPKNYVERRDKYHNLNIDDNLFTTFVGDFIVDFGIVLTVIIFIVFNLYVLYQIRPRDGTLKLHQVLLLYFTMCVCMQGGMTLFPYSDGANLRVVVIFSLYAYLRYHEKLLEKFPLKTQAHEEND